MSELKVYADFSMGMNDTVAPDKLSDKELRKAYNVDLTERGGFSNRKGTEKVNSNSFNYELEQYIEWFLKGAIKKLGVMNNKLYEIQGDTLVELKLLQSSTIGYFFMKDTFYFSDGTEYYVIDDTMTVSAVTPDVAGDNDLAPVKKCKYFVWHSTSLRIFASGNPDDPTALYFSETNSPDYFKSNSIVYPANSEGAITALSTLQRNILVSYNNSWWHWVGTDPQTDAVWERLPIPIGCTSHKSITLTPNSFTFLANDGLYLIDAGILYQDIAIVKGSEMIVNLTEGRMEKTIKSITNSSKTVAVFHDNKYRLAFSDIEGETRNNKILVYDWSNKGFSIDTGIQVNDFLSSTDSNIYIATKNYLLQGDTGYSDIDVETGNPKAINFEITTKSYHLDYPLRLKYLTNLFIMFKQHDNEQSNIDVNILSDYKQKTIANVELVESLLWGSKWGNVFGFVEYVQKNIIVNEFGKRFEINLKNSNIDDTVTCYALGFKFMPLNDTGKMFIEDEEVLLK